MQPFNYSIQDLLGASLAFLLFPFLLVIPGYVTGWVFNLFDFKLRSLLTRLGIALVLSFSISPILIYLCWRIVSFEFSFIVLTAFFLAFISILVKNNHPIKQVYSSKYSKIAICLAIGWVAFTFLSLIDLQLGSRLYYSVVSIDYTTRVSITDAVARTGVPPINPSYYPGHPASLTSLYYFWYVLTGFVNKIGTHWINGRNAMAAGTAWAGLGLMAAISLYLRFRIPIDFRKRWRLAFIGMGLLALGGLDIIPNLILLISTRLALGKFLFDGIIEHWNEQIATWLTSILWDPHHIASLIVCMTCLMLLQNAAGKKRPYQIAAMGIAGVALASSFGLSIWVTIVFCSFWAGWFFYLIFIQKQYFLATMMALSGVTAVIMAFPFIRDLLNGSGSYAEFPLALNIRKFNFALPFILGLPVIWQNIIHLLLLPFNYFLELGFFFNAAIIWLKHDRKNTQIKELHIKSEIFLLVTTVFLASFVKSTVIGNNDFGWRAWLPGQFILLIWGTDVLYRILENEKFSIKNLLRLPKIIEKENSLLALYFIIGLITTVANATYLRAWPLAIDAGLSMPHMLSEDTHLGERSYSARKTYEFINSNIPIGQTIQNNPVINLDRPLGLYGNHQSVISNISIYGISQDEYNLYVSNIKPIFYPTGLPEWSSIDQTCRQYFINFIIIADTDPLWPSLPMLELKRDALNKNDYYAVFKCGNSQ